MAKADLPRTMEVTPRACYQDRPVTVLATTRERLRRYPLRLDAAVAVAVLAVSLRRCSTRVVAAATRPGLAFGLAVLQSLLRRYGPFSVSLAVGLATAAQPAGSGRRSPCSPAAAPTRRSLWNS